MLSGVFETVCLDFKATLVDVGYGAGHVHLLISYPPKVSISTLVNSLKGVSARLLRAQRLSDVENKLWGKHFWSPSYCAVSCGGTTEDHQAVHQTPKGLLPTLKGGISALENQG